MGEELHRDAYQRIQIGSRGNQQLGRRCVVKKAAAGDPSGKVSRDQRHPNWRAVRNFDQFVAVIFSDFWRAAYLKTA